MTPDDIKLPAEIEALRRDPLVYEGQRVMTTELLAIAYGTDADKIHDSHRRNEGRFVENVHFVRLNGAALRAFKDNPANCRLVGARAKHLILWLDRGAARHAKLIETDEAWQVFGKLEDAYFTGATERTAPAALGSRVREAVTVFASYKRLCRMIGLDKNQAAISANQATLKRTGENVLADVGATHLLAPQQAAILTPTQIGERLGGLSGKRVNLLLVERSYQVAIPHTKGGSAWEPTTEGSRYAIWQDTGKRHGDGTAVRQLKWSAEVLPALSLQGRAAA